MGGSHGEKEFVKRFYEQVISENQEEQIGDYIAEDCVLQTGDERFPLGACGMLEHLRATKRTYPDYTVRILRQYQEGAVVVSEFLMTGTHKGVFVGIQPTDRVITISGVNIDRVIDGKIVEHGGAANTFEAFWENHLIAPWNAEAQ